MMTKQFLSLSLLLLIVGCLTQNKSGSQATPASASHFTPDMNIDSPTPQGRFELTEKCVSASDKSYSSRLNLQGEAYSFEITEYRGPRCTGLNADYLQTGRLERTEGSSQLTFTPQHLSFRYYQIRPDALHACGRNAYLSNSSLWIGEASECPAIKLPPLRAQLTPVALILEPSFPEEFASLSAKIAAKWTFTPNSLSAPEPDRARFLCQNLTDAVVKEDICTPLDFVQADEKSLLEFEKDTGLYPRINPIKRVLQKGTDETRTFKILYRFPCTLKNLANPNAMTLEAITIQFENSGGTPYFLTPTSPDRSKTFELTGRGDLVLLQDTEVFASETLKLSRYQVDLKCSLSIEVEPN